MKLYLLSIFLMVLRKKNLILKIIGLIDMIISWVIVLKLLPSFLKTIRPEMLLLVPVSYSL